MKIIYLVLFLFILGCNPKNNQNTDDEQSSTVLEEAEIEEIEEVVQPEKSVDNEKELYQKLKSAINNNDLDQLASLIKEGADLNAIPNQYLDTTLLSLACKKGALEIVDLLVKNGADINSGSGEFETRYNPLGASIKSNNKEVLQYLLNKDIDLNSAMAYIHETDTLMIDFLVKKGIDLSGKYSIDAEWEVSRLEHALMKEENNLARYLISKGAKIDFGVVAVLKSQEQFDIIKSSGLNFNNFEDQIKETTGEPSIYSVLSFKSKDQVKLYLNNGFIPTANTLTTLFNETELLIIALQNNQTDTFIDINETFEFHPFASTNYSGESSSIPDNRTTLLSLAVFKRNLESIKALIKFGADPRKPDIHGNLPSHYASGDNKKDIELLLSEVPDDSKN